MSIHVINIDDKMISIQQKLNVICHTNNDNDNDNDNNNKNNNNNNNNVETGGFPQPGVMLCSPVTSA